MAWETEARAPWYVRFMVHIILAVGAVFFLLPLIWMMATSLKPLNETMKYPDNPVEVFVGEGYSAQIQDVQGKMQAYGVVLEREMKPLPKGPDGKVPPYFPDKRFQAHRVLTSSLWVASSEEDSRVPRCASTSRGLHTQTLLE